MPSNYDPDGTGEFAIGFGDGNDTTVQAAAITNADSAVKNVRDSLNAVHAATLSRIDSCIAECRAGMSECWSCIHGAIDNKIDKLGSLVNQWRGRVDKHLYNSLDNVTSQFLNLYGMFDPNDPRFIAITGVGRQEGTPSNLLPNEPPLDNRGGLTVGHVTVPTVPTVPGGGIIDNDNKYEQPVIINTPEIKSGIIQSTNPPPVCGKIGQQDCIDGEEYPLWIDGFFRGCVNIVTGELRCGVTPPPPPPPPPCDDDKCPPNPGNQNCKYDGKQPEIKCDSCDGVTLVTVCDGISLEQNCKDAGGTWEPGSINGLGICHIPDQPGTVLVNEDLILQDDQGYPAFCIRSRTDAIAFLAADKTGQWALHLDSATGHEWLERHDTGDIHEIDGTELPCPPPFDPPDCPRPAGYKGKLYLLTDDNGLSQWVDENGTPHGAPCRPQKCPRPREAPDTAVLAQFANGSMIWYDPATDTTYGDWCYKQPDCETEECVLPVPPQTPERDPAECSPQRWIDWKTYFETFEGGEEVSPVEDFAQFLREKIAGASTGEKTELGWVASGLVAAMSAAFASGFVIVTALGSLVQNFTPLARHCASWPTSYYAGLQGIFNLFGGWFGFVSPQARYLLNQRMNYACPVETPAEPNLNAARLRKKINKDEWEFGIKLNGICPSWAQRVYEAQTEYVPGPADLVHFMVRDVFDPTTVDKLELSDEFEEKFDNSEDAKRIAEKQGIDRETMLKYWQAHWKNLAPGQIYEIMQRAAPDQDLKTPDGKPVSFTPDDARKLLKIADLPPAMIDYLMAISYRRVEKRDARLLWITNAVDEDGLKKLLRQQGYSTDDTETLTKGFIRAWADPKAAMQGNLSTKDIARLYKEDFINRDQAASALLSLGLHGDEIQPMLDTLSINRQARDTKELLTRYRRSYLNGRIDDDEYRGYMSDAGVDHDRMNEILSRDRNIKLVSNRQLTLAKLCKLASTGHLDMQTYIKRAKNLGFNEADASLLAQSCATEIMEKRNKELEQLQRKAQQQAEKEQKQRDRAEKRIKQAYLDSLPCRPTKPACPTNGTH